MKYHFSVNYNYDISLTSGCINGYGKLPVPDACNTQGGLTVILLDGHCLARKFSRLFGEIKLE